MDLKGATEIAKGIGNGDATVTFLYVMEQVPVHATEHVPAAILTETCETTRSKLAELAAELPNSRSVVIDGPTGRSITNWAVEIGIDCIVIPSHRLVMSDLLLGSTAIWVVPHAHCAVHVIRYTCGA